ncbi:MAG TPA: hypothetical protein VM101_11325 [Flavitalea sp.]|nr:hypothetical protein [Flavitalea sp.]
MDIRNLTYKQLKGQLKLVIGSYVNNKNRSVQYIADIYIGQLLTELRRRRNSQMA